MKRPTIDLPAIVLLALMLVNTNVSTPDPSHVTALVVIDIRNLYALRGVAGHIERLQ